MSLSVCLLGKPVIERSGVPTPPAKGRKAWGLLAYLLLSERQSSREQLASLLFADADDPLRALRWNLTELRRLLGDPELFRGEQIQVELPPGSFVDVRVLRSGTWVEAIRLPGLGRDLLEGMDFPSSAAFETWLLNQRRHLTGTSEAILHEAALAKLGSGDVEAAIDLAARLVAIDPLHESYQGLLIRCYAAVGDEASAARQMAACVELFKRELGVEVGPSVTSAGKVSAASATISPGGGGAGARAQLEAGEAAIKAGALDAGLQCLRRAAAEAHSLGDIDLKVRTMLALGSALAHCGRGKQDEAATALHEVISMTERTGRHALLAAEAHRELAWLELLAARYGRAEARLRQALPLAADDLAEQSAIYFVLGMGLTEGGRYEESMVHLRRSIALAEPAGDNKQLVRSFSMLGKAHLLKRELAPARTHLEHSLEIARSEGWTWAVPWPETYLGEVEFAEGDIDGAEQRFEHAFALGCQSGDPCFTSKSGAGLGLVEARRGNVEGAIARLEDARMRLVRIPDHTWSMACALDSLCGVAVEHRVPGASKWVDDLQNLTSRTDMRELLVHSYLHRFRLGDTTSLEVARLLSREVDNPYLHATIEDAEASRQLV